MPVTWIINPATDHSKDGTLPYDLAFPFHSLKFNPNLLIPKSKFIIILKFIIIIILTFMLLSLVAFLIDFCSSSLIGS